MPWCGGRRLQVFRAGGCAQIKIAGVALRFYTHGQLHQEPIAWISAGLEVFVFLGQNGVKRFGVGGSHQSFFERFVFEDPGNAGQHLEVQPGGILRRDQQKEDVGRTVVNGLEVDALTADTEPEEQMLQVAQLAVRYADSPPPMPVLPNRSLSRSTRTMSSTAMLAVRATGVANSSRMPNLSWDFRWGIMASGLRASRIFMVAITVPNDRQFSKRHGVNPGKGVTPHRDGVAIQALG